MIEYKLIHILHQSYEYDSDISYALLTLFASAVLGLFILPWTPIAPGWLDAIRLPYLCVLMGGIGGATYCLRAVYLNVCVRKRWDEEWHIWYYIRPFVSLVCGGVSYVFLKAGLLVLEAERAGGTTDLGFLALAFVAGLNVDRFISKIEDIARTVWGIEKSRTAKGIDDHGSKDL